MQKVCKNCNQRFEIKERDLIFYDQVKVPAPSLCPDCRAMQRLAFRNERTFYKRKCDLCQKSMVSLYAEDSAFPVYCHECWWSDKWDPKNFAQDYDRNKNFFEQYKVLENKKVVIDNFQDKTVAFRIINEAIEHYTNTFGQ